MTARIRSLKETDLPALIRLLNKTYENEYEFVPYDEEELRSRVREGRLLILIAEENGEVIGSTAYSASHWGEHVRWLAVSKGSNQKMMKHTLVGEIEKYVKGTTVFTSVDAESPRIDDWIEMDYKPEGGLYQMIARLDGVKPLPQVPEEIIVRSLRPDEEKELIETVNAGFGWERLEVGIIQRWKDDCPPFSEEWVHVAELNGKLISVVGSRPDVDYNRSFGGRRGYLGPAVTLLEHRSKNLASALTRKAMNFLFEKGMDSAALHTGEQNTPSVILLRKLGFDIGHHWRFMRKTLPPKSASDKV